MRNSASGAVGIAVAVAVTGGCELVAGLSGIEFTGSAASAGGSGGATGAAGGTGASEAGGGGAMPCTEPEECPLSPTECQLPACIDSLCDFENTDVMACEDGGTCDGDGRCTDKMNGAGCVDEVDCHSGHCVAGTCDTGVIWAHAFGNGQPQLAPAIAADSAGRVTFIGTAGNNTDLDFGNGTGALGTGQVFMAQLGAADGLALWATRTGGAEAVAQDVGVSTSDEITITGTFDGMVTFAGATENGLGNGRIDQFYARVASNGQSSVYSEIALAQIAGPGVFEARLATRSGSSLVALAGSYMGDELTIDGNDMGLSSDYDAFAALLDGTPNATWAVPFHSGGTESVLSVALDSTGNVYLAGTSSDAMVDFGGSCPAVPGMPFVVKLGSGGVCQWGRGGAAVSASVRVAVAPDDSVVLVGGFQGTLSFGGPTPLTTPETSAYVVKLEGDGDFVWSTQFGGSASPELAEATGAAVDTQGNVAVVGSYIGSLLFPTRTLVNVDNLTDDGFILKLTADGGYVWSKSFGAAGGQFPMDVATDPAGNVLVTGHFQGEVLNFWESSFSLSSAGGGLDTDVFVLKLAP